MRIGGVNRSVRRKPAPVPLCPPKVPHDLIWDGTWTAAVGRRRTLIKWIKEETAVEKERRNKRIKDDK
jgi:hypothetical protein